MERPNLNAIDKIIMEKWDSADVMSISNHHDHSCEIPWVVKNYAGSFCKRQFQSAQALGGHMNVHRGERARLRLLSPLTVAELHNNPSDLNPNPKFSSVSPSSSTLSAMLLPYHNYMTPRSVLSPDHPLTPFASTKKDMKMIFNFDRSSSSTIPLSASSDQGNDSSDMKARNMKEALVFEDGDLKGYSRKSYCIQAFKTENMIRTFDLETGLPKDHKDDVVLSFDLVTFSLGIYKITTQVKW